MPCFLLILLQYPQPFMPQRGGSPEIQVQKRRLQCAICSPAAPKNRGAETLLPFDFYFLPAFISFIIALFARNSE